MEKVKHIHKSGNKYDQNNFRPITILCTHSNILESHVHAVLYNFFFKNSLLYLTQSGFRALHSIQFNQYHAIFIVQLLYCYQLELFTMFLAFRSTANWLSSVITFFSEFYIFVIMH